MLRFRSAALLLPCLFMALTLFAQPVDDIVDRRIYEERRLPDYAPLREADLFWEKRLWRIIDTREKMNLHFAYPPAPFFDLIKEAAENGELTLYDPIDDSFSQPLTDLEGILFQRDTIPILDPEDLTTTTVVVDNDMSADQVPRFRIKEHWFFDEATSSLQVRILGIAPIINVYGEQGEFRYEKPLFWIYYPELRPLLAKQTVFMPGNDREVLSWADIFDMRYFSSVIVKEQNRRDTRIKDYLSGLDQLLEAKQIEETLFNFEQDLWSY